MAVDESANAIPGRADRAVAQKGCDDSNCGGAGDHLQASEAENQATHGPEALPRQLEANHEQQEHHAELGEMRHLRRAFDRQIGQPRQRLMKGAETERAEQHACGQESEDRADLPAPQDRHHDAGGRQEEHHVLVVAAGCVACHHDTFRGGGSLACARRRGVRRECCSELGRIDGDRLAPLAGRGVGGKVQGGREPAKGDERQSGDLLLLGDDLVGPGRLYGVDSGQGKRTRERHHRLGNARRQDRPRFSDANSWLAANHR